MARKLILVGHAHNNYKEQARIARLLEYIKPDRITLEWSTDREELRKNGGFLDGQVAPIAVVQEFAARNRIPLEYIDDEWRERAPGFDIASGFAKMMRINNAQDALLKKYSTGYDDEELFGIRSKILACPFLDLHAHGIELSPDWAHDIYRKYVAGEITPGEMRAYFKGYGMRIGCASEASMAAKIRVAFEALKEGTLVHFGGLFHLIELGDAKTLYLLLKDLNPEMVLAADFD